MRSRSFSQLQCHQGLGPGADTMSDIVPRHDQRRPLIILSADDDMGMGMAGVEMVHRHPVELGVQVLLHLPERSRMNGFNWRSRVLSSADTINRNWCGSPSDRSRNACHPHRRVRVIQAARVSISVDTITLNVAQVPSSCAELAGC